MVQNFHVRLTESEAFPEVIFILPECVVGFDVWPSAFTAEVAGTPANYPWISRGKRGRIQITYGLHKIGICLQYLRFPG